MSRQAPRLVVIGLDGATPALLESFVAAGELPVLGRLMAEGRWGPLRSVVHPFTAQAWTSMATGTQQGKHRVFDFWERDFNTYGFRLLNASHRAMPAVWNLLSQAGRSMIVVNVPQTFPPEPIQGVMVSGRDTPGLDAPYTHPPELKAELNALGDEPYVIVPDDWLWAQRGRPDRARQELLQEVDIRFDAVAHLMRTRSWDLAFFVTSATDGVAHFFWKYHDPGHPLYDPDQAARFGDTIREVYRHCDRRIGELLEQLAEEEPCNVLVVSDHGQGPLGRQAIHLNLWLEQQGLLRFRAADSQLSASARLTVLASRAVRRGKQAVYGRVSFQNLARLRRMWPDSLRTRLGAEAFFPGVDWAGTQAFSEELRGNIWINLRGRDPQGTVEPGAAYEALRERIIAGLPGLRDAETGLQPVRRVWRREELYEGPFLERLPDLVVEAEYPDMFRPHGGYRGPAARQLDLAELAAKPITGCHRQDGIVIAWGPDVQAGAQLAGATLVDVAPTMLHLLGHPVPVEMDGRVLVEALRPEVAAAVQVTSLEELGVSVAGVAVGYTDMEAERVRERLAGLGYLG